MNDPRDSDSENRPVRPRRSRTTRFVVNALVGLASLVISLLLLEVSLRLLAPSSSTYSVLIPNLNAVLEPDETIMPGISGPARYSVNSQGIRGSEIRAGRSEYRILAVGGSTTECLYLDQSETWPQLLQEKLAETSAIENIWVGDVGRSGTTARDHVVQLKHLADQIPDLETVVVLVGVNDLTVALKQGGEYRLPQPITEPEAEKIQSRKAFLLAPGRFHSPGTDYLLDPHAPAFKRSATWQLLKRVRMVIESRRGTNALAQDYHGTIYEVWRSHRQSAAEIREALPDLELPLIEYRQNLNALADIAESYGIQLTIMTQPSLWRDDLSAHEDSLLWLGGVGDFQSEPGRPYYSAAALARGMRAFNLALIQVAQDRGVDLLDLDTRVPKDLRFFFDDVHFTEEGARKVASVLADHLSQRAPFSKPADSPDPTLQ